MTSRSFRSRLLKSLDSRPFLKNVLTLVSGTAAAQAVGIILAIPLAWLYSPEAFGLFGIIQAIVAVLVTVAASRYDLAIVLPEQDSHARVIMKLARRSIVVVSLLSALVLLVMSSWFEKHYDSHMLGQWMWTAGILTYLTSQAANLQFWYTRKTRYKVIAYNRVLQTTGVAIFQLALYKLLPDFRGLLVGTILGQLLALAFLTHQNRSDEPVDLTDAPTCWQMAKKYWRMPIYNAPTALVDGVRSNGIIMIIGLAGANVVGQYSQAYRMMQVPLGFVTASVTQVFYQRLATIKPGEMTPLVKEAVKKLGMVGFLPFLVLGLIAPWLFPFVFGPQWDQAGYFAQAITPWMFMLVMTSPISNIFIVTDTQKWMLVFSTIYTVATLGVLALSPWSMLATVWVMSCVNAALLAGMLIMAVLAARRYDARRAEDAQSEDEIRPQS
ncbi:O-antigen/teichoic acid export membrane protein [Trueperella bonasi]|uniref:O-antigen/teichoic acid export membrane protein n=1 Tax=Trueperella bonasi TaxID=312286 RepID=A0ABT9NGS5_9ACTO|nr:oligosaccharide flippase family protein [Trueperella bonasi]MDP9806013.1 O-antigen/teichoic acid export membrane protein [Trueperella bonasi]